MAYSYNPNDSPLSQISGQTSSEANPRFSADNGNASASTPFLSSTLSSSTDSLTGLSNRGQGPGWGAVGQNIANVNRQQTNQQLSIWASHQAQVNNDNAQKRLQKLVDQAEKAGNAAQAKAYQQEQALMRQIKQNATQYNNSQHSYVNGGLAVQGSGAAGSARGVSAAGRSQLATARADGYNLSSSNYDRTYHYNNAYSGLRNSALSQAYSWLGTHYVLGGERNQVAVDCSGLVQAIYSKLGFSVPTHSAADQGQTGGRSNGNGIPGVRVSFSSLQPGDLVAWKDGSHIAIYAGNGQIIEAANTNVGTVRRTLWDSPSNVVGIHLTFGDERTATGNGRRA